MKYRFTFLTLFSCIFSYGQLIKKDSSHLKFSTGFYNNLFYYNAVADKKTNEKVYIFSYEIKPYLSYYFYKNIGIGALFSYEFYKSNFYNKKKFKEYGFYLDYVFPYKIDRFIFRKVHFYLKPGYFFTNYLKVSETVETVTYKNIIIEEDYIIENRFNYSMVCMPIGLKFNVWEELNINARWQYLIFLTGGNVNGFTLGLSYNIPK
jgi:hypothetical protein